MGFTDDLTFITIRHSRYLLKAIGNSAPGQIVWRHFHRDLIAGEDTDKMHPHFPRDMSQYDMAIIKLDPKHGVRKRLRHRALNFNNVFFCHVLLYSFLAN